MVMAGDDLLGGGNAEQDTDVERARIAHALIAGVRGLAPQSQRQVRLTETAHALVTGP
jgi:hypothetical protein